MGVGERLFAPSSTPFAFDFSPTSCTIRPVRDLEQELQAARQAIDRLRRYVPPVIAAAVLDDQERLRGERREIAVLFVDAVNFTHLSTSLDAESVFGLINGLLDRLVTCVHRYDGLVDKYTGDGLIAVFGAPIAHENDSELAIRAALDMQKAVAEFDTIARTQLGAPLEMRIGIHNGLAIAGVIGTTDQLAYTVIGETVNLAARLESLAQPGSILVSARVYQQTRPFFDFQSMGAIQVKGLDQPQTVYQVLHHRAVPLPTRGVAGVRTIFLGRDTELDQLRKLLQAFQHDQQGRLVLIQGDAGMGKSRLVSEWLSAISPQQATVWQGRGLPYTQGVGYGVFRSLLQDSLRLAPPDAACDAQVSPPLRPFLRQVAGQASQEDDALLRQLEPERVRQLTILALREWILSQASIKPLLLIMEDFHWADDLSHDALNTLSTVIHDAPVLLCVISRPQPEFSIDTPPHLTLPIKPITPEEARTLLAHLVAIDDLPAATVDTILTRAQGNPFYIEEFVRMLIEKEVLSLRDERWRVTSPLALQALEIPTTLRGLMMARVDRLPQDMQDALRSASVIGLQFSAPLLEEVERRLHGITNLPLLLERLVDLGLLAQRPESGAQVYAFRHILTQETIYNSLLRSQRPTLHQTVAECIETLYAANLTAQAEVLAFHYDRAYVRDRAMHYALLAGDRARERFANREAIEHYSRALQLSQHLSEYGAERGRAAMGLGDVLLHIGDYEEAIAIYRATLEEWSEAGLEVRARIMLRLGQVWDKRGDLEEAEGWLRQGLGQLEHIAAPLPDLRAQAYSDLGWLNLRRGDLHATEHWLQQGLALVADSEHYAVLSSILNRLGALHYHRGAWDRAAQCVQQSLELRERLGDIVGVARSSNNLGVLKKNSGHWEQALAYYQRSMELAEIIGDTESVAIGHTNMGNVYMDLGEWDRAETHYQNSMAISQRIAHSHELAQAHTNLGHLYLLQGHYAQCAHHLNAAIPLYEESGARANLNLNETYELLGRLQLALGNPIAAAEWAQRSRGLLEQVMGSEQNGAEWGRYERLMGRIASVRGDTDEARQHLDRSIEIMRTGGALLELGRTLYCSARLWQEQGQLDRARDELGAAREYLLQLNAQADLRQVEQAISALERPVG